MFKNLEELKNNIINLLKSIIKNPHNKQVIELLSNKGYLAAEKGAQIKVYTDTDKNNSNSLHLAYCELYQCNGIENNRHAKQFIKDNTIQGLLIEAKQSIEKDNLKIQAAEKTKYLLIDLSNKINNYIESLFLDLKNIDVIFKEHNQEYSINFNQCIGERYFNIYFKITESENFIYNDVYEEDKKEFNNIDDVFNYFVNSVSPAVEKVNNFLNMYKIIETNFKNNLGKKILFQKEEKFYTLIIDTQYINLNLINRKKEKAIYNYLYLKQVVEMFIKDDISSFIIIDNTIDLSIKNLRNIIDNDCIFIKEDYTKIIEENKNDKINDLLTPEVAADPEQEEKEIKNITLDNDYIYIELNVNNKNIENIITQNNIDIKDIEKCFIEHLKNDRGEYQIIKIYLKNEYVTSCKIYLKDYIHIITAAEKAAENGIELLINDINKFKSNDEYIKLLDNRIILSNKGYHKKDLLLLDYNINMLSDEQKNTIENKCDIYIRTIKEINYNNILDNFNNIDKIVNTINKRRIEILYNNVKIELRYKYTQENQNIFKIVITEPAAKENIIYRELAETAVISLLHQYFNNYSIVDPETKILYNA